MVFGSQTCPVRLAATSRLGRNAGHWEAQGRILVAISKGWEGPPDPSGRTAPQAGHAA